MDQGEAFWQFSFLQVTGKEHKATQRSHHEKNETDRGHSAAFSCVLKQKHHQCDGSDSSVDEYKGPLGCFALKNRNKQGYAEYSGHREKCNYYYHSFLGLSVRLSPGEKDTIILWKNVTGGGLCDLT